MKHTILMKVFLLLLTCFYTFPLLAQHCKFSYGTKTLYVPPKPSTATVPNGYKPVFINHVGRHGARHLTKDPGASFAASLLFKADSINALTKRGLELKKMLMVLRQVETAGLKSISSEGVDEQRGIGERMVSRHAELFKHPGIAIQIDVTKEVRTSQSADAFLQGFPGDSIAAPNKTISDTTLRFYDLSPSYLSFEHSGNWKEQIAIIDSAGAGVRQDLEQFAAKFFKASFMISAAQRLEFCKDIYGFATIVPSISKEIMQAGINAVDIDFVKLFTCKQLSALSLLDEAEDFLVKGPGADTLGIQIKIAVPLLVDFINTSDEFLKNSTGALCLRFAHAETISPFASLTQMLPASAAVSNINNFRKTWHADKIIPLSANIQWIFYKGTGFNDYLVKLMLNETEVPIKGVKTNSFPFYKWEELRKFYIQLLSRLDVKPGDDMGSYLLNLR